MASNAQALIDAIVSVQSNPMAIQRVQLNALRNVLDGTTDLVDSSNPFVFLMEMGSVLGAATMTANKVSSRKQYPALALTQDDLYLHMSDLDYVGNFSTPGIADVFLLFDKDEIYANVVPTGQGNIAQVTIPRETYFQVGQYVFTMQYPINIRVMGHGGLQITYDDSIVSPLQNLASNVVDWSVINIQGKPYIKLTIPCYQMQISTSYGGINAATGFSMTYGYPNLYYYARVYVADFSTHKWSEIVTTYTDQVFDPTIPTAVLKVLAGNQLQVDIPQIYLTTGQIATEIRVDIFTTLGSLDVVLTNYQLSAWTATFVDLDSSTDQAYLSPFVAPLKSLTTIQPGSSDTVTGGASAVPFAQLRTRVMANATGNNSLPITNAQLGTSLADRGYDAVIDVDDVTNRVFLATRILPAPAPPDTSVSSSMGCSVMSLQDSMNDLVTHSTVSDNGNRITLQPKTLYRVDNGVVTVVNDATVTSLLAMAKESLVSAINSTSFVYTPFHYVLDINDNAFGTRAYYLDSPTVESKGFVAENDTLGMVVSSRFYQIKRTHVSDGGGAVNGYELYVTTQSDATFEGLDNSQIYVQLSYVPEGETALAYINGVFVSRCNPDGTINTSGVERLYKFVLGSNYDVDKTDNLCLTTASMFTNAPAPTFTGMTTMFNVIYGVHGVSIPGQTGSSIDAFLNTTGLPSGVVGLVQEEFLVQLGYAMTTMGLWHRSRSVVSSRDYARYTTVVYWTYAEDVYARDPVTGNILISNNGGVLQYTVIHHAGDTILDATTHQPLVKYNVGDVIVDGNGNPTVTVTRNMLRMTDMVMFDGVYWFTTAVNALNYANSIPQLIYGWLTNDIAVFSKNLLEQTELFLYPKSTMGLVSGTVLADKPVTLEARLSFTVDYYLSGANYRNLDLRNSLTNLASKTLAAAVQESTIAMNQVSETLTNAAGNDVSALQISGLGGTANNYAMFSTTDDSIRLSIGKIAYVAADGSIGVQDDITVNFQQHTVN
jgi:hypothetical protein